MEKVHPMYIGTNTSLELYGKLGGEKSRLSDQSKGKEKLGRGQKGRFFLAEVYLGKKRRRKNAATQAGVHHK